MKASKKYLAFLAFLLILLMVPQKGFAAVDYTGGWLDGVRVDLASGENTIPGNFVISDNNEGSAYTLTGRAGDADRAIAKFVEPATVRAIRLKADKGLSVAFFNNSGEYIQVNNENVTKISSEQADGRLIEIPRTIYISKVALINDSKEPVNISEFNLYEYVMKPPVLSTNAGSNSVNLKWNRVAAAEYYTIERSTTPGGPYQKIDSVLGSASTYHDRNLVNGKTYYYVITPVNPIGSGPKSNEASVTPSSEATLDIESSTDYSGGWLDGYYVGYCLSEDGTYVELASSKDGFQRPVIPDYRKDSGMFSMTGRTGRGGDQGRAIANLVEPATVRAIRLNANNALSVAFFDKDGAYIKVNGENVTKISLEQADGRLIEIPRTSGIASVALFNDPMKPEPVNVFEFNIYEYAMKPPALSTNAETNSVNLKWSQVADTIGYTIERSTTPGGPYEKIGDVADGTTTTYRDLNLENGKTYYYVVTPIYDNKTGLKSNEVSATPQASEVTLDIESAKEKVLLDETFTVAAVLNNATNIYAEDFNVTYDKTQFQLVNVEAADHMGLFHKGNVSEDTIRLITASLGKDYGINGKGTLVHFTFKAIGLGKGKIDVAKGKIADNGTTETTLADRNFGEKVIEVVVDGSGGNGNGDGKSTNFTLKHLGFLGFNYTEDKNKLTDELKNLLGSAGNVADVDLVQLTNAILANPNYDFNK
ncbi:cohesin domain-containing protein [Paenibacillus alvei]|uniref:cohesin domain-containing protein n=1 Tax=Paenibacillus alvei TaxID=44250 RepID=UPI003D29BF8A